MFVSEIDGYLMLASFIGSLSKLILFVLLYTAILVYKNL